MHESSIGNMKTFKEKYLKDTLGKVLDVGSQDVNGTYRDIFENWNYTGFDINPGKNVDVTNWKDLKNKKFDAIICGQVFEHVENDIELIEKIAKHLKKGGYCCIIAPSTGPKHGYPGDYRRYQPNDFLDLALFAKLEVLECKINGTNPWNDCILIAKKV